MADEGQADARDRLGAKGKIVKGVTDQGRRRRGKKKVWVHVKIEGEGEKKKKCGCRAKLKEGSRR